MHPPSLSLSLLTLALQFGSGVYLTNDAGVALQVGARAAGASSPLAHMRACPLMVAAADLPQFSAPARGAAEASLAAVMETRVIASPAVGCFARGLAVPLRRHASGAALPDFSCYVLVPDATHLHVG